MRNEDIHNIQSMIFFTCNTHIQAISALASRYSPTWPHLAINTTGLWTTPPPGPNQALSYGSLLSDPILPSCLPKATLHAAKRINYIIYVMLLLKTFQTFAVRLKIYLIVSPCKTQIPPNHLSLSLISLCSSTWAFLFFLRKHKIGLHLKCFTCYSFCSRHLSHRFCQATPCSAKINLFRETFSDLCISRGHPN